jgi:hypothetical protein
MYDSQTKFPPRSKTEAPDPYEWRAYVRATDSNARSTLFYFPPVQLKSTDNKYDFNRELNKYTDSLKNDGYTIVSVQVGQGSFSPSQA